MPRNAQNKYFSVGIPRNSELLQKLQQDADACGLQVAQLIALRVHDWYKGVQPITSLAVPPTATTEEAETKDEPVEKVAVVAEVEANDEQMLANVDALLDLDAW